MTQIIFLVTTANAAALNFSGQPLSIPKPAIDSGKLKDELILTFI